MEPITRPVTRQTAHEPTAIEKAIAAVHAKYPDRYLGIVGIILNAVPSDVLHELADERRMASSDPTGPRSIP